MHVTLSLVRTRKRKVHFTNGEKSGAHTLQHVDDIRDREKKRVKTQQRETQTKRKGQWLTGGYTCWQVALFYNF